VPTTRIAIDRDSDKRNGRSTLQGCVMQCESRENGPIVHNGVERENEKLSVHNITSRLRLNLPDSTSVPPSHLIVKPCRVRRTSSNSQLSETSIRLFSVELFGLSDPSLNEFVVFDLSLVFSVLSLAHRRFFMCSGQSFKFLHGAVFGGTVVNFNGVSGTSWDRGWWTFDKGTWR